MTNGDSGICPVECLAKTSAVDDYASRMLLNKVPMNTSSGKKSPELRTITTTTITVHRDEDIPPYHEPGNKRCRVIRPHIAQKASDLTLSVGDSVFVSVIYSDGMAYGYVSRSAKSIR